MSKSGCYKLKRRRVDALKMMDHIKNELFEFGYYDALDLLVKSCELAKIDDGIDNLYGDGTAKNMITLRMN